MNHCLVEEARSVSYTLRWDWADDLLEWFDYYLR